MSILQSRAHDGQEVALVRPQGQETQRVLGRCPDSSCISKHFGIGGTWKFHPFAGWNVLMIVPRSEVIDPTPNVDSLVPGNERDADLDFVFAEQDTIFRNRFLFGAKFQYSFLQLTIEAQFALAGSSVDDRAGTNEMCMPNSRTANCDAKDTDAAQRTVSISAGFDL